MSQELLNENIKKAQEEIEKTKDKVSEGKMRQNIILWHNRAGLMIQMV